MIELEKKLVKERNAKARDMAQTLARKHEVILSIRAFYSQTSFQFSLTETKKGT